MKNPSLKEIEQLIKSEKFKQEFTNCLKEAWEAQLDKIFFGVTLPPSKTETPKPQN